MQTSEIAVPLQGPGYFFNITEDVGVEDGRNIEGT
jgi:hypothetical protein